MREHQERREAKAAGAAPPRPVGLSLAPRQTARERQAAAESLPRQCSRGRSAARRHIFGVMIPQETRAPALPAGCER